MIRLRLLGAVALTRDDGSAIPMATQRRPLAMLVLLAMAGERGISRDKLLAYLWPERDGERARHALAQTLYVLRRDLRAPDAVLGTVDLRLNPEVVEIDVAAFERAVAIGDADQVALLHVGPFLDGFHLDDAPEFARWVDGERARLTSQLRRSFERAARAATAEGDVHRAVEWWRRVTTIDPLDPRAASSLIEGLVAIGDRAGALQHARAHEAYVRGELDEPPDPAVTALVERVRAAAPAPVPVAVQAPPVRQDRAGEVPGPPPDVTVTAGETAPVPEQPPDAPSRVRWRRSWGIPAAAAAAAMLVLGARSMLRSEPGAPRVPVIAVGAVRDYQGTDTSGVARTMTDMLATNLARVPNLRVISSARIYELVGQSRVAGDLSSQLGTAARLAGAADLVEGTMYQVRPGLLRFDVRRLDLATGSIRRVYRVEGADPFALVDSVTARLAADVSPGTPPPLPVAGVTSRSLVAHRFYEEGLHAFYQQNDAPRARRLFLAALGEDSTFAMAEYFVAKCEIRLGMPSAADRFVRAARLAEHATERERLLIRATTAFHWNLPNGGAVAETLVTRYPVEPDGHYLLGQAITYRGDFLGGVPHLSRVVVMDSLSLRGPTESCRACDALDAIAIAYSLADSLTAAERTARAWVQQQPGSTRAWWSLLGTLVHQGRHAEVHEVMNTLKRLQGDGPDWHTTAIMGLREANFVSVDSTLRREARLRPASDASWYLTLSLRNQGRLREALTVARAHRMAGGHPGRVSVAEAIVLFDLGRFREAASAFASLASVPAVRPELRSRFARDQAWYLTHAATALAAAGDTAALAVLADSIERLGARSAYGRDQRLHLYVRGLLERGRGNLSRAAENLRHGIFSPTFGYTRNSYELARTLLALERGAEAIAVLRPAFHGPLDGSNSYVTHMELHELLASAFEATGQRDSAIVHYGWVARALGGADEGLRSRRDLAARRVKQLAGDTGGAP